MVVPAHRRPLFALLERVVPGIDRERVWSGLDIRAPRPGEPLLEERIDAALRRVQPLVVAFALLVLSAGVWLVWAAGPRLAAAAAGGHPWLAIGTPFALAVVVHGVFILVVHEATHGNLLGRPADDWLGSIASGVLLLPFTAEVFQPVHRVHHFLTNRPGDTNWSPFRQRLFARSRLLYALYELVPVVNCLDRTRARYPRDRRRVAAAWAAALATWAVLRPPFGYWLLVLVGLNLLTTLRFWIEHFVFASERSSNTYWFPLSFGIGNHEVHHQNPGISALALAIGLWFRAKSHLLPVAPLCVLFSSGYRHFRTFQPDFDGRNV